MACGLNAVEVATSGVETAVFNGVDISKNTFWRRKKLKQGILSL